MYDFLLEDGTGDVVRTVSTSSIVDRVAEAHGQNVHEVAVGFKWVADAMAEHDALFGGEESGGFGLPDHLRNKDGVLVALAAAAAEREEPLDARVDRLLDEHGEIHQDRISVDCSDDRKEPVLEDLETALPETLAESLSTASTPSTASKSASKTGRGCSSARPGRNRRSASTPRPAARPESANCSKRARNWSHRSSKPAARVVDAWTPTSRSPTRGDA